MTIWFSTPAHLRVAAVFAAWFVYGAAISNLLTLEDNDHVAPLVWGVCLGGVAIVMAVDAAVHHRYCSAEDIRVYRRAMRDAELPEGADPDIWRGRTSQSRLATAVTSTLLIPLLTFGWMAATYSQTAFHQLPQWGFAAAVIVTSVASCRRFAQIDRLESEIERCRALDIRSAAVRDRLQDQAELSLSARIFSYTVACAALAFAVIALADLEAIVYGPDRGSHLLWIFVVAAAVGLMVTIVVVQDPSLRVTTFTVDEISAYERALRTTEVPTEIDIARWRRWVRARRRADVALLLWAGFYASIAAWSIASHSSGYRWVVAMLLAALVAWQLHCFRLRRARGSLLAAQLDRMSGQTNL